MAAPSVLRKKNETSSIMVSGTRFSVGRGRLAWPEVGLLLCVVKFLLWVPVCPSTYASYVQFDIVTSIVAIRSVLYVVKGEALRHPIGT